MVRVIKSYFCFLFCFMVILGFSKEALSKKIILGFVQVSSEGTWRMTNTQSVKEAAELADIHLLYREGANKYTNQLKEMKELILSGVDVLAFSPSQNDGWDDILKEAKQAGIPVIVLDRAINVGDESLFVTHIGSDMIEEGRRAARWLLKDMEEKGRQGEEIRIAILEGVEGSTPAIHRDQGFREVLKDHANYQIVRSQPANFIYAKAQEVMAEFLRAEEGNIDVVFAHNDEMALGAADAVEAYGLKPGQDVVIIGVDAIKKVFEEMIKGRINASIECSPLLGPQLMEAVKKVVAGEEIPREIITVEKDYDQKNAAEAISSRTY